MTRHQLKKQIQLHWKFADPKTWSETQNKIKMYLTVGVQGDWRITLKAITSKIVKI
jgi:hypothetical protein